MSIASVTRGGEAQTEGDNVRLLGWRGAIAESELEPTTRLVALTLSLHMSETGDSASPSVATMARRTGLGERTVQMHLGKLVKKGWLTREERFRRNGGSSSNLYVATTPGCGSILDGHQR